MNKPTLENIVILGKFSDNHVRQIVCDEAHQILVLTAMDSIRVIDTPLDGIEWESKVNINKKINIKF